MKHLDEGLLNAWLDGEIDEAEDLRVQTHLTSCSGCAERLDLAARDRAAASELIGELGPPVQLVQVSSGAVAPADESDGHEPPIRRARGSWQRPLAWAASMVLAVALGWFARAPAPAPVPVPAPLVVTEVPPAARALESGRQAVLAEAATDEILQESAAAAAPGAAMRAAAPRTEAVSIPASSVASWLGREPLQPSRSELLAARLLPAGALREGVGGAPIVELDLRLPDGRVLRLWQQRVGPGMAAASDAEAGRAAAVIGGLLVVAEGEAAAQTLASLSALDSR